MTNPGDIVRVRARKNGHASVYDTNGWAQAYRSGLLDGNGVTQNTSADMNVLVGGSSSKPDILLAQNPFGFRVGLSIEGKQAIQLTAPASNSRIASIVAYTDDLSLPSEDQDKTGSPSSCGLIVVYGATNANPTPPTNDEIRTAITADGATGLQASYAVIANVILTASTTTITNTLITNNTVVHNDSYYPVETLVGKHNGEDKYARSFSGTISSAANSRNVTVIGSLGIEANLVKGEGKWSSSINAQYTYPNTQTNATGSIQIASSITILNDPDNGIHGDVQFITYCNATRNNAPYSLTIYYTKF